MENFQGDLTDVVRAGSIVRHVEPSNTIEVPDSSSSWPAPSDHHLPLDFPSSSSDGHTSFGDPFLNVGDPLLHELDLVVVANPTTINNNNKYNNNGGDGNSKLVVDSKIFEEDMMMKRQQGNIFPRIKISGDFAEASPCNSPGLAVSSPVASINANSPKNCHQLQISSPRTIGLKRRKNQAKKVVCVPAPAAANSRTSGEVVPSDLWAWRKYGQKPIKGSPYPRGYYRCSSSKGCSARKQVERSRTDPNMLVISYTSEHNHPWPTQRNALAGSIRSNNPTKTPTSNTSDSSRGSHQNPKEESIISNILNASTVKEEMDDRINGKDNEENTDQLYLPDFQPSDDFFADLDELEGDSLSLLLTQGSDKHGVDPLSDFFNWPEDENNNNKNNVRVSQEDGTGSP